MGHSYSTYTIAPTCEEYGYTTYTCYCGDSYVSDYVDPMGHDYVYHAGQSATCTENGWNAYETCTRCDYNTWSEIIATGHSYNGYVTSPTCTEQGYTTYICHCGDSYISDYVDAMGHSYSTYTIAPTCEGYGYTTYTCYCGDSYVSDYMDPMGHDYVYHAGQSATCTENGWNAYETCSRCDYTTYEEIPALGHDEVNNEAKAPTCTEIGWNAYVTCSRCDYTTYEEIAATGHNYNKVVTTPTCVEQGYTTYTCHCGESYVSDYVKANGHMESNWIVDKEPEIGVKGHKHTECTVCGETLKEEDIPALNKPQDSSSSEKPEPEIPDSSSSAKPEKPDSSKPTIPSEPSNPLAALGCFGAIHNKTMIMVMVLLAFTLFMSKKAKYQN